MKSFEERRKDYFQRLRKYSKMLIELTKDKKNQKLAEVILTPKNELELEFGNYYIMYIEDTLQISANASIDNVERINLEESIYIEYLSSVITSLYNNKSIEEIKKLDESYMKNGAELLAKVFYQMLIITITNPEGLAESLCKKCGFDIDDEIQVMQLSVLMKSASEQIQPEILPVNDEKINGFISFVKHFHNFCIKGIKDHSNQEVKEMLEELFNEEEPTEGFTKSRNIK